MRPLMSKTPLILCRMLKAAILRSRPAYPLAVARKRGQGRPKGPSRSDLPLTGPRTMAPLGQVGRTPPNFSIDRSDGSCH